jgi:hypothetical protein
VETEICHSVCILELESKCQHCSWYMQSLGSAGGWWLMAVGCSMLLVGKGRRCRLRSPSPFFYLPRGPLVDPYLPLSTFPVPLTFQSNLIIARSLMF